MQLDSEAIELCRVACDGSINLRRKGRSNVEASWKNISDR
jgi:hypothetical protein